MNKKPDRGNFPARNRIISGLALGTVVIEAGEKSGALITTQFALDQGRDVFAIPGNISSLKSKGTNFLIKNGAKLVDRVEDIIEELPMNIKEILKKKKDSVFSKTTRLTEEERNILLAIKPTASHIDSIIEQSSLSPGKVSSLLLKLELNGVVKQLPGKMFVIC